MAKGDAQKHLIIRSILAIDQVTKKIIIAQKNLIVFEIVLNNVQIL
jgi:hypothetical protein